MCLEGPSDNLQVIGHWPNLPDELQNLWLPSMT